MTGSSSSNASALADALQAWRQDGRLDDGGEVLATLAQTSARLVDAACAPDSDVAAYARAQVLRTHAAVLVQLTAAVGPGRGDEDPWEAIARELEGA